MDNVHNLVDYSKFRVTNDDHDVSSATRDSFHGQRTLLLVSVAKSSDCHLWLVSVIKSQETLTAIGFCISDFRDFSIETE